MNPNFLSRAWSDFAPALGNHLWQSTLFVVVVALLTLADFFLYLHFTNGSSFLRLVPSPAANTSNLSYFYTEIRR